MSGLASDRLLRTSIFTKPARDQALVDGYASGAVETKSAMLPSVGVVIPRTMKPNGAKIRQMRSYDRAKTWGRKREMGGAGKLPNTIRCWFTEGERAVLTIIGQFVKRYGQCTLSVERLSDLAGVSVRTVQYTLELARGGKVRRGRRPESPSRPVLIHVEYRRERGRVRNNTNVITIVSREWLLWLNYRPSEKPDTGCTKVQSNLILNVQPLSPREKLTANRAADPPQGAWEEGWSHRAWSGERDKCFQPRKTDGTKHI